MSVCSLCGSVVEHRSPHGDPKFFLSPTLVTSRKSIFLRLFLTELRTYHLSHSIYFGVVYVIR